MSNLVEPDFGRNPFIEVGDCVVFQGTTMSGQDIGEVDGMVHEVISRYSDGPIRGQAKLMEVGVPIGGKRSFQSEGEWAIMEVAFTEIICRRFKSVSDYCERAGKVFQFEPVSCNDPRDMV